MKKQLLIMIVASIAVLLSGCATEKWTNEQIAMKEKEIVSSLDTQHMEQYNIYKTETEKNKEMIELMNNLQREVASLNRKNRNLSSDLTNLEELIDYTQKSTLGSLKKYMSDADKATYDRVLAEQKELMDQLKTQIANVEVAHKQAKKLDDVLTKISKAYQEANESKQNSDVYPDTNVAALETANNEE